MQNVSGIKKWNYEKLPLNFAMQFPFPFPVIPGNNNVSFPFPKCGNGISIPVPKNWEWNFPVPVPKSWEWNFSFPFPFPKFGNGLSHSRSRSQMTKSHSRSPLLGTIFCSQITFSVVRRGLKLSNIPHFHKGELCREQQGGKMSNRNRCLVMLHATFRLFLDR